MSKRSAGARTRSNAFPVTFIKKGCVVCMKIFAVFLGVGVLFVLIPTINFCVLEGKYALTYMRRQ